MHRVGSSGSTWTGSQNLRRAGGQPKRNTRRAGVTKGGMMLKTTFAIKRDELKVVMERTFDAPREAVFKAFTDPHAIPQWWGPKRLTTTVDRMDVRPGGVWRFVQRDAEGNEYAFHGVYKEIDAPRLLSSTFNFEGIPGDHELLQTVTFEDLGGKTKVKI